MDKVFIRDLRVDTVIGVYDWERQVKQTLVFDLDMAWDIRQAAAADDLRHTLNYQAVAETVQAFVGAQQAQLVETLAEQVAQLIRTEFQVPWVRVQLSKPHAVLGARAVGVIIERGQLPA